MALFEGYERRIAQLQPVLEKYGFKDFEELKACNYCQGRGRLQPSSSGIQPIAFENAEWAYTLGAAIALKKGVKTAAEAAECIGEGLQAFCIPGSVADQRKVGLGHGNLGAMLLREETECFCLPGRPRVLRRRGGRHRHRPQRQQGPQDSPCASSSTAWARTPRMIISRINGFTYVQTKYDYYATERA